MPQPQVVLACYRAKKSASAAKIRALLKEHEAVLLREKLRTKREPWVIQSVKNPLEWIEIFEWADEKASSRAHHNPAVMEMWGKFSALVDGVGVSLASLAEGKDHFAYFRAVKL